MNDLYLFTNLNNVRFVGTIMLENEKSFTIKIVTDHGYNGQGTHVIPREFIKYSLCLSRLVPGQTYTIVSNGKTFNANLIDVYNRTTLRVDNVSTCPTPTCVYSMPLKQISRITSKNVQP
jgi:hypothetical protein